MCEGQLRVEQLQGHLSLQAEVRGQIDHTHPTPADERLDAVSGQLRRDIQTRHIAAQILRSGTAAAPNYGEARAAESRADFIHKLKIALKELNETSIWLRVLQGIVAVQPDFLARLIAENTELCKILVASIQTARLNDLKK